MDRLEEIRHLARRLDPEPAHAFQVRKLALALYDELNGLHGLGEEPRQLLEAGALLHDIGHTRDPIGHHKHARDMIMETDLPGFCLAERSIVACLARYHRKALPQPSHKVYRDLHAGEQRVVQQLAAILRVADGLDRAHLCSAHKVEVECAEQTVRIIVGQRMPSALDIWGAMRKRDLFEQIYAVRVMVETKVLDGR